MRKPQAYSPAEGQELYTGMGEAKCPRAPRCMGIRVEGMAPLQAESQVGAARRMTGEVQKPDLEAMDV